jgi:hypothetical protein
VEEKIMSFKTNFKHVGMTLFVFCLPVILFIAILFTSYYKAGELQWSDSASKSAVYFGLVCLITIPGFLLHCCYYLHDKGKSLKFESTHIELGNPLQAYRVYIKDIQKVKVHSLLWSKRLPWINYGYTEVFLNNGDRLKFTNLLFDTTSSRNYFKSTNAIVEHVADFYTWIK